MKRTLVLFTLMMILALALSACAPAAPAPAQPAAPVAEEAAPAAVEPAAPACEDEWGCAEIGAGETIKLGYVGPMTGDYSSFGIDMSRGVELAVAEHPQVKGHDIELLVEDTQGSPEQGAAVANKFAADPRLVAVDGHTFSGSTEVAIPIYEKAGIVMMSPSATNPPLTALGSAVFNRVAFTDEMQGKTAAEYIFNELGITKIAMVHDGGAYGQGLAELTAKYFEAAGGEVVGSEPITPGETDYSAPLAAIAAREPELIYYGGYAADAAVLTSQMAAAGLGDALFFGCDGTYGTEYIELAGDAADGAFSTFVPIPESAAFDKFRADYEEIYGDPQGKLSPFSPHAHDAAAILINAIEAVAIESGDTLFIPRKALAEAVRSTADYDALTGNITCTDNGECAAAAILFMKVEGGEWVPGPGQ